MSKLRPFAMPKWGIEMTEGTLTEWNIKEGDRVSKGQVVAQIETDKIVNEVQSEFDAIFVRFLAKAGEVYPVGALLAVLASEPVADEAIDSFVRAFNGESTAPEAASTGPHGADFAPADPAASTPPDLAISPAAKQLAARLKIVASDVSGSGRRGRITYQDVEQASKPARAVGGGSAVSIAVNSAALDASFASPFAKRLAIEHGVDLAKLTGTGPRGRISRGDVAKSAGLSLDSRSADASSYEAVKMSGTRKAIARQLTLSKTTIPHFYLRTEVRLDALLELRADAKRTAGHASSVNDYFIRASALALAQSPDMNIQVHGDEIRRFRHVNIAVAVATERGLITPVVRAAQEKSLAAVTETVRELIERARAGKLRTEEIEGGTFTISNLGMFGIDEFDAIINPPQGAILAVGSAARRPIEQGGGLSIGTTARLSLSCDHRAIDGAVGAQFLATLRGLLEEPRRL